MPDQAWPGRPRSKRHPVDEQGTDRRSYFHRPAKRLHARLQVNVTHMIPDQEWDNRAENPNHEAVLADLHPASVDDELLPALAFPGFEFSMSRIDDDYWRDTRSVIRPDGTPLGELRPWMMAELAKNHGDAAALWRRLKETDLQMTEWRGTRAFVFAPTGQG